MEDDLVSSLWQQLPAELLEKVLSKLPLSALRKFSRVSKRWKALFRSVEFARECDSIEWTFFYLDLRGELSDMLFPNTKTNSWDKQSLGFLAADEWIADFLNPLTRKWRRLTVPHQLERNVPGHKIMWALMVDKEIGSYKVVVAFCDQDLPRKAFIYHSVSNSWSISAALTPLLVPHFDIVVWNVRSIICSNGELLWLIEESEADGLIYKWLIKYNFELDAWSTVTQESPDLYEEATDLYEERVDLFHHEVENRPVMVNLQEIRPDRPNSWNLPSSARFPAEFLTLVPNFGKVGMEDIECLVNAAGDTEWPANFEPCQVAFGGGTWYFVSDLPFGVYRLCLDVFAVSINPPTVTRLPKVYDQTVLTLGTFAATLKAFV
ncbi:hypothetical protein R1sor_026819 [Riccia sorocarpa]|uniref:F-box domain-containing protein n=1 Tax=Riccia sorocarpa TaxID=122646 RepID=A0ABD3GG59_9MARC